MYDSWMPVEPDRGVYRQAKPVGHSGPCWAAALGRARRGQAKYETPQAHIDAALNLMMNAGFCICRKRHTAVARTKARGRG